MLILGLFAQTTAMFEAFVDDLAGGDVLKTLTQVTQYEVIQMRTSDRMMMTVEVETVPWIGATAQSDARGYWCVQCHGD